MSQTTLHKALAYIGVEVSDFALTNSLFARPHHEPIHGIGHIYRTMLACALLGYQLQRPREALLAFCGAYVHDLSRLTDGVESSHGAQAARHAFPRFQSLWNKYDLTPLECQWVCSAVEQHSTTEWSTLAEPDYHVMAILKDADALDRCRLGDLDPHKLRYPQSRLLVPVIAHYYALTHNVNHDLTLSDFIDLLS